MRKAEQERAERERIESIQQNLRNETARNQSSLFGVRSLLGSNAAGGRWRTLLGGQ